MKHLWILLIAFILTACAPVRRSTAERDALVDQSYQYLRDARDAPVNSDRYAYDQEQFAALQLQASSVDPFLH